MSTMLLPPSLSSPARRVVPYTESGNYSAKGTSVGPGVQAARVLLPVMGNDMSVRDNRQNAAASARQVQSDMAAALRDQATQDAAMQRAQLNAKVNQGYYDQMAENALRSYEYRAEQDKLDRQESADLRGRQTEAFGTWRDAYEDHAKLQSTGASKHLARALESITDDQLKSWQKETKMKGEYDRNKVLGEYLKENTEVAQALRERADEHFKNELIGSTERLRALSMATKEGILMPPEAMPVSQPEKLNTGEVNQNLQDIFNKLGDKIEPKTAKSTDTGSATLNELNEEINEKQKVLGELLMEAGSRGTAKQKELEAEMSPVRGFIGDIGKFIEGPLMGTSNKESRVLEGIGLTPGEAAAALGLTDSRYTAYPDSRAERLGLNIAGGISGAFKSPITSAQEESDDLDRRIKILQDALGE